MTTDLETSSDLQKLLDDSKAHPGPGPLHGIADYFFSVGEESRGLNYRAQAQIVEILSDSKDLQARMEFASTIRQLGQFARADFIEACVDEELLWRDRDHPERGWCLGCHHDESCTYGRRREACIAQSKRGEDCKEKAKRSFTIQNNAGRSWVPQIKDRQIHTCGGPISANTEIMNDSGFQARFGWVCGFIESVTCSWDWWVNNHLGLFYHPKQEFPSGARQYRHIGIWSWDQDPYGKFRDDSGLPRLSVWSLYHPIRTIRLMSHPEITNRYTFPGTKDIRISVRCRDPRGAFYVDGIADEEVKRFTVDKTWPGIHFVLRD